jgi:hypothetical protein
MENISIEDTEIQENVPIENTTEEEIKINKASKSIFNKKEKTKEILIPQEYYSIPISKIKYYEEEEDAVVWDLDKKNIESATLNGIIEELTSPLLSDIHFTETFMLTYRSFTDRDTLLNKLADRFNLPPNDDMTNEEFTFWKKDKLDKVRLKVTNTIKYWLENFYELDFDEKTNKKLDIMMNMMEKSKCAHLSNILKNTRQKVVDGGMKVISNHKKK